MPQATPGARKIADELDVNLEDVTGTGKKGYILEGDVAQYANSMVPATAAEPFAEHGREQDLGFIPLGEMTPAGVRELLAGVVLPVSILGDLRFRQDKDDEFNGGDLLAIRPKAVGGRFRSTPAVLGWFVADRGLFAPKVEDEILVVTPQPEPEQVVEIPEGNGFALSE